MTAAFAGTDFQLGGGGHFADAGVGDAGQEPPRRRRPARADLAEETGVRFAEQEHGGGMASGGWTHADRPTSSDEWGHRARRRGRFSLPGRRRRPFRRRRRPGRLRSGRGRRGPGRRGSPGAWRRRFSWRAGASTLGTSPPESLRPAQKCEPPSSFFVRPTM